MLVRLQEQPFFPSKPKATHTTWKINDWLGDCCLLGSLKRGQCLFTLRRGRWFNGWHSASGCSFRTLRQPHPGWPGLHLPLAPCLGFYVLKKVTKQMDIHGRKTFRILTCNDVCWAPKFPPPNCWIVHNLEETSLWLSLPCPTYPLPEKGMDWGDFWSDLTYGRWELCFHTCLFWGTPVSRLLWPLWSYSFTSPHTPLSPVLTTAFIPSQLCLMMLPTTEQELPGVLAQHIMLSSQAKPRSLSLPTLSHFFLVQQRSLFYWPAQHTGLFAGVTKYMSWYNNQLLPRLEGKRL